ncbi:uncharacterized protein LOC106873516 [Octopus bimaculoides]|uniref:G-protein coupled receptors family 1 profile domain-containing protein n=1 Tax=Octopus bimaculoides TaxID=37653 RepID=A0A0L8H171_OCTBM|nr:uncharacterized protein LOC106873516 [Octopus bimaculoides]|eukprot:XP_014776386.1 PREDICTED: uncharacterized protein LOC106873516 [Octopus bimaculoides]
MNSSATHALEPDEFAKISFVLRQYFMPSAIIFGMTTNILTAILFKKFHSKESKIAPLLMAIAIVDTIYLFCLLLTWIESFSVDIYEAPGLCQIQVFCSHYFAFLSFWYLAWIVFLIIFSSLAPNKYHSMRSSGMVTLCFVGITIFAFTGYLYKTWTFGTSEIYGRKMCTIITGTQSAMKLIYVLDTFFMSICPSAVFVIFHIMLLLRCVRLPLYSTDTSNDHSITNGTEEYRLVVALTVLYYIFIFPNIVSQTFNFMETVYNKEIISLFNIFQQLFNAYFALKPIVYVFFSSSYRQAFVNCLKSLCRNLSCQSSKTRVIAVPTDETTV